MERLQIGADCLEKQALHFAAPLRCHQLLDQYPVFKSFINEAPDGFFIGRRLQTAFNGLLQGLILAPLHHIHNILKVIVKRLTADVAGVHQFLDCNYIQRLMFEKFVQGLRNLCFHINWSGFLCLV